MKTEIPAPNYTQVPNAILDAMPSMDNQTFRVVMALCRQTFGWHKRRDKVSLSQLVQLTGLSKRGVLNGVAKGIEDGFIKRAAASSDPRDGYYYSVRVVEKVVNDVHHQTTDDSKRRSPGVVNDVHHKAEKVVNDVHLQKKDSCIKESTKENVECVSTNNVPPRAKPTAAATDLQSHTQHPQQVSSSRIPAQPPPTQTGVLTADRQALLDAVLDLTGKRRQYEMGNVAPSWTQNLNKLLSMLEADKRTPTDVLMVRDKWPLFLNNPQATCMSIEQALNRFDDVFNFVPREKTNGNHNPQHRDSNGFETTQQRRFREHQQLRRELVESIGEDMARGLIPTG